MNWHKIVKINDRVCEELNNSAIHYCSERDWQSFENWVKEHGITNYCYLNEREDIPRLLKTGKNTAEYSRTIPNPTREQRLHIADNFDHGRIYKNSTTNECWLVCHIYNNTYALIERLSKWCYNNDLEINFLYSSWYNPGHALGIVIRAKGEYGNE